MIVMGLDLSLRSTGIAIVDAAALAIAPRNALLYLGAVTPRPVRKGAPAREYAGRCFFVAKTIRELAESYAVQSVYAEGYSFGSQFGSHQLGELGGWVACRLRELALTLERVPPASARKLIFGAGGAGAGRKQLKKHSLDRIRAVFGADGASLCRNNDESDAFVVANWATSQAGFPALTLSKVINVRNA